MRTERHHEENDINPLLMKAALEKNMEVRQNLNWLHIEGAITTEDNDE